MQHIDKEIFKQEGVVKRLQFLNKWYYIFSAAGIVCTVSYLLATNLPDILSALLLMGLAVGDFCLAVTVCYHLFGDRRKPYDTTSEIYLERSFNYYPGSSQQQLAAVLSEGSRDAFDKIKCCTTSDLLVVCYRNEKNGVCHCQLVKQQESREVPLTEIFKLQ